MPGNRSKAKTAEVITVGNEIITGKITDTNSAVIARFLIRLGYNVVRCTSVGDDEAAIRKSVSSAMKRSDLVAMSGGLGLTHDDVTKAALIKLFKCGVKLNRHVLKDIKSFFKQAGRTMTEPVRRYAYIPSAAVPVKNSVGLAPGLFFDRKALVLPGVPREMEKMLETAAKLIPKSGACVRERILHTAGISESAIEAKIAGLKEALRETDIAFLPDRGRVAIRIMAWAKTSKAASAKVKRTEKIIRKDISQYIWGTDDETMEKVAGRLLRTAKKSLAVAESCTGGGIGSAITSQPGSSDYFLGGVIAYSNEVKVKELGVSNATLKKYGAVSKQTALEMARGARKRFGADYALSATGTAGPTGGTKEKPVGLTFIALSGPKGDVSRRLNLGLDRDTNRERTAFEALRLLYERLTAI